ncbi:tripartite motif-containing protein 75-like [Sorex fumeus]|uniref:tripartite motif-containing protein 75-like n=1 Tax=Sorex fumeus TaxID=62283 RepID=UPI0024ADEE39|nr:tripartite motif-containing protein 75-like [Sorex fumeus]
MEVWEALAKMQPDLICRICLDYINDPVTIDCGHSFCDSCIHMSSKELQDTFPCPVCPQSRQEMRVSANAQLGRLVDLAKLLHSSRSSEMAVAEEGRCEEHRQGVSLFCEDDQELVCPQCAQGPTHQGHQVRSIGEAAAHHRQRLGDCIKSLKKQLVELQKLEVAQDRNILQLREDMGKHRNQLALEFEQLTQFVEREHEAVLCRLTEEDKRLQQQLRDNLEAYSDHISELKDLRREVAERSVMSEEMVLRGVRGLQQCCAGLQPPAVQPLRFWPVAYSLPPLHPLLNSIIRRFRERISLDPDTAHPNLRVSQDLQSVTCVRESSKGDGDPWPWDDTAQLVVLGREGFASGCHYWEVQVGAKPEWAVGVCSVVPSAQTSRPLAAPKRCWTLQLQDGDYLALRMEVLAKLAKMQAELICPIYLDYSVTIDLEHNFCDCCISLSRKDMQDRYYCPVCGQPRQEKSVSAIAQLGRLVDLAKFTTAPKCSRCFPSHSKVLSLSTSEVFNSPALEQQ